MRKRPAPSTGPLFASLSGAIIAICLFVVIFT